MGLASYGEDEVLRNLKAGKVDTILLSEALDVSRIEITYSNCGYSEIKKVEEQELEIFLSKLGIEKCPKCGSQAYSVTSETSYLDEILKIAASVNANIEMISAKSEEGVMLIRGFGGIAAILKD
jgi:peptide chain release factor subunit 1